MISIKIEDADALRALGINMAEMQRRIGQAVAKDDVLPLVARYPGASHKPQPFKSSQQRRAFFAKLRSGAITVPYRRTGKLSGGWGISTTADGAEVANGVSYAAMVMGDKGEQAAYFKGTWPDVVSVARTAEASAQSTAEGVVVDMVVEAGG